jgi:hypothetical protein
MNTENNNPIKKAYDEIKSAYSPSLKTLGKTNPEVPYMYDGSLEVLVCEKDKTILVIKDDGDLVNIGKYNTENEKIKFNRTNLNKILTSEKKNAYLHLTSDILDVLNSHPLFSNYTFNIKDNIKS